MGERPSPPAPEVQDPRDVDNPFKWTASRGHLTRLQESPRHVIIVAPSAAETSAVSVECAPEPQSRAEMAQDDAACGPDARASASQECSEVQIGSIGKASTFDVSDNFSLLQCWLGLACLIAQHRC